MSGVDEGALQTEVGEGIGWLVVDRPARHNALSPAMQHELPGALARLADTEGVRVIVIRGAGERAFVAGADIDGLDPTAPQPLDRPADGALFDVPVPVIAMIRGHCIGGGVMIAAAADLRIASADATFGIPAARLGVGYFQHAVRRLVALVGPAVTARLLLAAETFDAAEALRVGLIDRLVAPGDLEAETATLAGRIAGLAPMTLRAAKAGITAASLGSPPDRVTTAMELIGACWSSEDFHEGRAAFTGKRPPRFRGR